jgi:hypothetical protein
MNPEAWQSLAIQAPIVLIFAGAIYVIVKELIRYIEKLTDKFMTFMEIRDKAISVTMQQIAKSFEDHDDRMRSFDQFVRERLKESE